MPDAPRQEHHLESVDQHYDDHRPGNKHPNPPHSLPSVSAVGHLPYGRWDYTHSRTALD